MCAPRELTEYKYKVTKNEIWIGYQSNGKVDDRNKFHIAVHNTPATLRKTIELVIPILKKYQVKSFKHLNPDPTGLNELDMRVALERSLYSSDLLSDILESVKKESICMLDGKAFCVYLENEYSQTGIDFLAIMIQEIEKTLKDNGIPLNAKGSLADGLLSGSQGYIYYRNPNNVLDIYLKAKFLKNAGFTRSEAQNISANNWSSAVSSRLTGICKEEVKSEEKNYSAQSPAKKPFSLSSTATDIKNRFKRQIAEGDFIKICLGEDKSNLDQLMNKNKEFYEYFGLLIYYPGYYYHTEYKLNAIKPYLKQAAQQIAEIHKRIIREKKLLGVNEKSKGNIPLGEIAPILYYHFFKPLYEHYIRNKAVDMTLLAEKYIDHYRLVNELVKCSLRDPRVVNIWSDRPHYIYGLSEEQVYALINKIPLPLAKPVTLSGSSLFASSKALSLPIVPDDILQESKAALVPR